jgi:L-alanine-DL-glutamate epimerase-like enolase superfamily enzyme
MEITAVETLGLSDIDFSETGWVSEIADEYRRLLFVRVHTDEGMVGLGETYPRPGVDAEVIHTHIAPELIGRDPGQIESIWRDTFRRANYWGGYGGAEMRALSAIDIALWDLKGRAAGLPIYALLGGKVRDSLRTYNTCYEGTYSFAEEPVALAESLLDDGIEAMKIWPYDEIAFANGGQYVSPKDLEEGATPIRRIKAELGDRMDVAMEFHGLWNVASAKRIARHMEQYDPMWLEELIEIGDVESYAEVARSTSLPVNVSERLMTKYQYNHLLSRVPVDVVMLDLEWVGGFSEAVKVAAMAEANQVPLAPHNCGGPVLHFANLQFGAALSNLMIMESVRGRYDGWHRDLVTTPGEGENGRLLIPEGPGLGTRLSESVLDADGIDRRVTET